MPDHASSSPRHQTLLKSLIAESSKHLPEEMTDIVCYTLMQFCLVTNPKNSLSLFAFSFSLKHVILRRRRDLMTSPGIRKLSNLEIDDCSKKFGRVLDLRLFTSLQYPISTSSTHVFTAPLDSRCKSAFMCEILLPVEATTVMISTSQSPGPK